MVNSIDRTHSWKVHAVGNERFLKSSLLNKVVQQNCEFSVKLFWTKMFSKSLPRNCLFEHINSLQCYELTRRCSPLPLMLASPLTYAVHPWSVHCKSAMKQNYVCNMYFDRIHWIQRKSFWKNSIAMVQDMDITVHKPYSFSSYACTWQGVLGKHVLFAIYNRMHYN